MLNYKIEQTPAELFSADEMFKQLEEIIFSVKNGKETLEEYLAFTRLLHFGNHHFTDQYNIRKSFNLLKFCIQKNAVYLAQALLNTDVNINDCAEILFYETAHCANIDIFNLLMKHLTNNFVKYHSSSIENLKENILHPLLKKAIKKSKVSFIKMLFEQYGEFYHSHDKNHLSPVNILFAAQDNLKTDVFYEIYNLMLLYDFKDINFENDKQRDRLALALINLKDFGHLKQMLDQGKDITFADENFLSPKEAIAAGKSVYTVTFDLIKGKYKLNDGKLPLTSDNLNYLDLHYRNEKIVLFCPEERKQLKRKLITLLEEIELGKTRFKEDVEIKLYQKILFFLKKDEKLFLEMIDRAFASFQLLRMFLNPESLDQGKNNLCGVASFTQMLIDTHPLEMLDIMIDFCEKGQIDEFETVSKINFDTNIFHAYIKAFKHQHSFYGYYQTNQYFETLLGGTKSKSIAQWMARLGYENIVDAWEVTNPSKQEISSLHQTVMGGFYSPEYYKSFKDRNQKFIQLIDFYEKNYSIILCIGSILARDPHQFIDGNIIPKFRKDPELMGLVFTHWVYLKEISYLKAKEEVTIKYMTYGKMYNYKLPLKTFLDEFYGMVVGKAPALLDISKKAKIQH